MLKRTPDWQSEAGIIGKKRQHSMLVCLNRRGFQSYGKKCGERTVSPPTSRGGERISMSLRVERDISSTFNNFPLPLNPWTLDPAAHWKLFLAVRIPGRGYAVFFSSRRRVSIAPAPKRSVKPPSPPPRIARRSLVSCCCQW